MSSIHELLARAAEKVGAIGKNATMTAGGTYKYRKVDDVIQAVHPVFAELGIVMSPQVVDVTYSTFQTKNGAEWRHALLTVEFHFYGPEGDEVVARTIGEATDSGDKSANKAHTGALKVALCQLLLIPFDSQDPDDTPSSSSEAAAPSTGPARRPPPQPAAEPATADPIFCAECGQEIRPGEKKQGRRGAFKHLTCPTDQQLADAVKDAFPGTETVGTDKTEYTKDEEPF